MYNYTRSQFKNKKIHNISCSKMNLRVKCLWTLSEIFLGQRGRDSRGGGGRRRWSIIMINLFRVVFVLFGDHFSRLVLLHGICLCKSFWVLASWGINLISNNFTPFSILMETVGMYVIVSIVLFIAVMTKKTLPNQSCDICRKYNVVKYWNGEIPNRTNGHIL